MLWVVDDEPSVRFPIYTRGNTGEVYPNVITPLCGSVVKGPIAEGQRRVFLEMGAITGRDLVETDRATITGCFGGYLYANLSLGRLVGARSPGMKPEDVDTQMFGTSGAPPHAPHRDDRSLRASLAMSGYMLRTLWSPDLTWLRQERDEVRTWAASRPEPAPASVEELLTTVDQGGQRFAALMRSLLKASMVAAGAAIADRLAGKADPEARARTTVGVGGVESAAPAAALWRMAQLDEGSTEFDTTLRQFLDTYGARGPDEWELASHTWGTDPAIALAAVAAMRGAPIADPAEVHARLVQERAAAIEEVARSVPAPVRGLFRRLTKTAGEGAAAREFAKGTIIEAAYAIRRALFELVRRAQDNGGPDERLDCWLVTRDELPAFVARPADFADVIAERRGQRELLQSRVPPFVFEGRIPDPSTWERRDAAATAGPAVAAGAVLEGIPVSPGRARGPARVVRDPADPSVLEPGDVLVAPITDPAWTPLFLVAAAVVVEVGANLSHAAIVARELGIPAVVSVPAATTRVRPGTMLEVDGTAGTVTVLP